MDRAALASYLATEYDTLLAEAGIGTTDTSAGDLKPVLDAVEQLATLSPELSPVWIQPLGRYYTLRRIVNRFATNMDVNRPSGSYRLQQQFANAKALLDIEAARVGWIVDPVSPAVVSAPAQPFTLSFPFLTGDPAGGGEW